MEPIQAQEREACGVDPKHAASSIYHHQCSLLSELESLPFSATIITEFEVYHSCFLRLCMVSPYWAIIGRYYADKNFKGEEQR